MHEEEALGKAYDLRLMTRLWRWVAPYRWQVGATLALIVPSFLIELAPAWIIKTGLDTVLSAGTSGAAEPDALGRLLLGPEWAPPLL